MKKTARQRGEKAATYLLTVAFFLVTAAIVLMWIGTAVENSGPGATLPSATMNHHNEGLA